MKPNSKYRLTAAQRRAKFTPKKYRLSVSDIRKAKLELEKVSIKPDAEGNISIPIQSNIGYKFSLGVSKPAEKTPLASEYSGSLSDFAKCENAPLTYPSLKDVMDYAKTVTQSLTSGTRSYRVTLRKNEDEEPGYYYTRDFTIVCRSITACVALVYEQNPELSGTWRVVEVREV